MTDNSFAMPLVLAYQVGGSDSPLTPGTLEGIA